MSNPHPILLGGLAAIIGGILRGVSSFVPSNGNSGAIAILYLITDIFITLGLIGIYGFQYRESKWWGCLGFAVAIAGIATIRTREILDIDLYPIGGSIFAAGLILLAVGTWIGEKLPRWIAASWIISTIVGFTGYFVPKFSPLFVISGVIFGISFVGAGIEMRRAIEKSLRSSSITALLFSIQTCHLLCTNIPIFLP